MCVGLSARVVRLQTDGTAIVDASGARREISAQLLFCRSFMLLSPVVNVAEYPHRVVALQLRPQGDHVLRKPDPGGEMVVQDQLTGEGAVLLPDGFQVSAAEGLHQRRQRVHRAQTIGIEGPSVQDETLKFQRAAARGQMGADPGDVLWLQNADRLTLGVL